MCYSTELIPEEINMVDDTAIENICNQQYNNGDGWSAPPETSQDLMEINMDLDRANTIIEDQNEEPARKKLKKIIRSDTTDWDTDRYFKNEWIEFLSENLQNKFNVKWLQEEPDLKKWLIINPNKENPDQTTFRCRICSENYDKRGLPWQSKPALAKDEGIILGSIKNKNREKLLEHVAGRSKRDKGQGTSTKKNSIHTDLILELIRDSKSKLKSNIEKLISAESQEPENTKLLATANMFRAVYAEALLNIPLYQHNNIVHLLKKSNVQLGTHHYERTSAFRMLLLMSDTFHTKLLHHLASSRYPISLILDATTDNRGKHFAIVYLKSLEADVYDGVVKQIRPVMYFYKLLEFGMEENAEAYLNILQSSFSDNAMERDVKFEEVIKNNLIALGSDGASVMIGKNHGLIVKLREYTGRSIVSVHCLAHRLHLATGRAWKDLSYFSEFEKLINNIYLFYNNRGHKRKAHLLTTATLMQQTFYEFSEIFHVRWITSELVAVSRVNKSYEILLTDLEQISTDLDFNLRTRNDAKELYDKIREKSFLALMKFVIDVLNLFSTLSKKLQSQYGVVIDKADLFETFRISLNRYKRQIALEEIKLYAYATCKNLEDEEETPCGSIEKYEGNTFVKFGQHILSRGVTFPRLSTIRTTFLNTLLNEVDKYFIPSEFEDYRSFEPRNLPTNILSIADHESIVSIVRLLNKFGLPLTTADEWIEVLKSMIASEKFELLQRSKNPVAFYGHFLADKTITWMPNIERFIQILLVIPIGSADAERGFSILKHIRYDRRSRLGKFDTHAHIYVNVSQE